MGSTAIRDLFRKPNNAPTLETIRKLAIGLDTSPEWLAFGIEGIGTFGEEGLSPASVGQPRVALPGASAELLTSEAKLIASRYAGVVQAGSFRDVDDLDEDPDRPPLWVPADRDYPEAAVVHFEVAGDSMNALKPRPIFPGDMVVGVDFEGLRGNVPLRDGMIVVVEQTLDGGQHRERSVKQVELYDDRVEFCPRSTNPKHKPIVVPRTVFTDPSEEDGRHVRVLALGRRIVNELAI